MRTTINISFPNDLYVFIRHRTAESAYASTSEYIRALVRADRERGPGGKRPRSPKHAVVRKANDVMAGVYD
jgi:Arc/MetJ-type ribon-helix-helix transcriptional regulator